MSIIGIDQSLTGTGLAEVTNDGILIRNKLIKTGKLVGIARLDLITKEILAFCVEAKERFVIAREGYSFGSRGRATFSLGELGGCIDLSLYRCNIPLLVSYYVISPNVVKKFCLGSGGIKKDSSYLLKVYNKFKIEFPDDNQADAFMIAKTLHGLLKGSCGSAVDHESFVNNLTVAEKESLLSSMMKEKELGITLATIKKMDRNIFAGHVLTGMQKILVFSRI